MSKFKKGDRVICTGEGYWKWAKGLTATVNSFGSYNWVQLRFDLYEHTYGTDTNGHSGPEEGVRHLTKLERALQ